MRTKTTAKKLVTTEDTNENSLNDVDQNKPEEISDSLETELEAKESNQFLEDGTLIIQPTQVDEEDIPETNFSNSISFEEFTSQFLKTISNNSNNTNNNVLRTWSNNSNVTCNSTHNNNLAVRCTACNRKFNPYFASNFNIHPTLKVSICSNCADNQKGNYFVIDSKDNKETLCRWCVDGGRLICCDFCSKSFCKSCIKRNLGHLFLKNILEQEDDVKWKCFVCDGSSIEHLQDDCKRVSANVEQFKSGKTSSIHNSSSGIKRAQSVNCVTGNSNHSSSSASSSNGGCHPTKKLKRSLPNTSNDIVVNDGVGADKNNNHLSSSSSSTIRPPANLSSIVSTGHQSKSLESIDSTAPPNIPELSAIFHPNNNQRHRQWMLNNHSLSKTLDSIDQLSASQLLPAISATKKCIESFYSDIRNVELEIARVTSLTDVNKMISMFQAVYRHHIINRFGQLQSRINEEAKATVLPSITISNVSSKLPPNNGSTNRKRKLKSTPSVTVMESIDLTDEPTGTIAKPAPRPIEQKQQLTSQRIPTGNIFDRAISNNLLLNNQEVVDLSDDEEGEEDDFDDGSGASKSSPNINGTSGGGSGAGDTNVSTPNIPAVTINLS